MSKKGDLKRILKRAKQEARREKAQRENEPSDRYRHSTKSSQTENEIYRLQRDINDIDQAKREKRWADEKRGRLISDTLLSPILGSRNERAAREFKKRTLEVLKYIATDEHVLLTIIVHAEQKKPILLGHSNFDQNRETVLAAMIRYTWPIAIAAAKQTPLEVLSGPYQADYLPQYHGGRMYVWSGKAIQAVDAGSLIKHKLLRKKSNIAPSFYSYLQVKHPWLDPDADGYINFQDKHEDATNIPKHASVRASVLGWLVRFIDNYRKLAMAQFDDLLKRLSGIEGTLQEISKARDEVIDEGKKLRAEMQSLKTDLDFAIQQNDNASQGEIQKTQMMQERVERILTQHNELSGKILKELSTPPSTSELMDMMEKAKRDG